MGDRRRKREWEVRRELLLEAASRVFSKRLFNEASMHEIAAEAQIGMQGLYHHFASKCELYEEMAAFRARLYQDRARGVEGLPPEVQLRALIHAFVRHFLDHPAFLPVFVHDRIIADWGFESRFSARMGAAYGIGRAHLRDLLAQMVEAGLIRPFEPEFLTELCLDIVQASLHFTHRHRSHEEVHACVNRALDAFLNGMGERA